MKNWYIADSTGIVPFNRKILSSIIYLIIDLIIYSISYWYRVHRPLYHWRFSAKVKLSFVTFFLMPCWKFHILFTCCSLTVVIRSSETNLFLSGAHATANLLLRSVLVDCSKLLFTITFPWYTQSVKLFMIYLILLNWNLFERYAVWRLRFLLDWETDFFLKQWSFINWFCVVV